MPTYNFDPFVLDSESRLLLRQGEIIPLTPKAFDILLLLLVSRSGRVVTKDEILNEVWTEEKFVEEWNLTQHIYTLRNALQDRQGKAHYIETAQRRGYRFIAKVSEAHSQQSSTAGLETHPFFHQLTYRRGVVFSARFAQDGSTVVYSAAFEGRSIECYAVGSAVETAESRALNLGDARLFAISSSGELLLSLRHRLLRGYIQSGTLARTSLSGSLQPRELLQDIQEAEWAPDGSGIAVVRDVAGRNRLEYPIGEVLYETGGWVSHPRFSPDGNLIAFIDHPLQNDDRGSITIVDCRRKQAQVISIEWISAQGLAWSPRADEIWFTATKAGNTRSLFAVKLNGQQRLVQRMAGALTLQDISRDGNVLVTRQSSRMAIIGLAPGETCERDLSWLDWSLARDLSADGQTLLFTEAGEGGGSTYGVYLRKTDGSPAVRLGNGSALALSPDGRWALAKITVPLSQMVLLPTGAGEPQILERSALSYQQWACWFPDGERILFTANEARRGTQLFVQNIKGGAPQCVTPEIEGVYLSSSNLISPDGEWVAAIGPDNKIYLYGMKGEVKEVHGVAAGEAPIRWSVDGKSLYVYGRRELPAKVCLIRIESGERILWKELMPRDSVGVIELLRVLLTPDGKSYVYTYTRDLSDLYTVSGLV